MGLPKGTTEKLRKIAGEKGVLTSPVDLLTYSYDGTTNWEAKPEVVVFPTTTDQVSEIMKLATQDVIPVTVRGAAPMSAEVRFQSSGVLFCAPPV
jgi:FAD/FMN-containing dehydrogenases